jgi:hypothetical protein
MPMNIMKVMFGAGTDLSGSSTCYSSYTWQMPNCTFVNKLFSLKHFLRFRILSEPKHIGEFDEN